ncbi:hypothetical protein DL93DRAFT_1557412 [Clavulina sp. PMI_390]|nr:hypothetical protein DL93DRAFT_1557412 [Clavulina sp. PMI_390]
MYTNLAATGSAKAPSAQAKATETSSAASRFVNPYVNAAVARPRTDALARSVSERSLLGPSSSSLSPPSAPPPVKATTSGLVSGSRPTHPTTTTTRPPFTKSRSVSSSSASTQQKRAAAADPDYRPDGRGATGGVAASASSSAHNSSGSTRVRSRPPKAQTNPPPGPDTTWIPKNLAGKMQFSDFQPGEYLDRNDWGPGMKFPDNLDPPPGLETLRCLFCEKQYAGVNARSMWRRHVAHKHDVVLAGAKNTAGSSGPRSRSRKKGGVYGVGPPRRANARRTAREEETAKVHDVADDSDEDDEEMDEDEFLADESMVVDQENEASDPESDFEFDPPPTTLPSAEPAVPELPTAEHKGPVLVADEKWDDDVPNSVLYPFSQLPRPAPATASTSTPAPLRRSFSTPAGVESISAFLLPAFEADTPVSSSKGKERAAGERVGSPPASYSFRSHSALDLQGPSFLGRSSTSTSSSSQPHSHPLAASSSSSSSDSGNGTTASSQQSNADSGDGAAGVFGPPRGGEQRDFFSVAAMKKHKVALLPSITLAGPASLRGSKGIQDVFSSPPAPRISGAPRSGLTPRWKPGASGLAGESFLDDSPLRGLSSRLPSTPDRGRALNTVTPARSDRKRLMSEETRRQWMSILDSPGPLGLVSSPASRLHSHATSMSISSLAGSFMVDSSPVQPLASGSSKGRSFFMPPPSSSPTAGGSGSGGEEVKENDGDALNSSTSSLASVLRGGSSASGSTVGASGNGATTNHRRMRSHSMLDTPGSSFSFMTRQSPRYTNGSYTRSSSVDIDNSLSSSLSTSFDDDPFRSLHLNPSSTPSSTFPWDLDMITRPAIRSPGILFTSSNSPFRLSGLGVKRSREDDEEEDDLRMNASPTKGSGLSVFGGLSDALEIDAYDWDRDMSPVKKRAKTSA